jgi:hypothetical protein
MDQLNHAEPCACSSQASPLKWNAQAINKMKFNKLPRLRQQLVFKRSRIAP